MLHTSHILRMCVLHSRLCAVSPPHAAVCYREQSDITGHPFYRHSHLSTWRVTSEPADCSLMPTHCCIRVVHLVSGCCILLCTSTPFHQHLYNNTYIPMTSLPCFYCILFLSYFTREIECNWNYRIMMFYYLSDQVCRERILKVR